MSDLVKRLNLHPCAVKGCGRLTSSRYCRRCIAKRRPHNRRPSVKAGETR